jgi:hypothetical protein
MHLLPGSDLDCETRYILFSYSWTGVYGDKIALEAVPRSGYEPHFLSKLRYQPRGTEARLSLPFSAQSSTFHVHTVLCKDSQALSLLRVYIERPQ